jgi:hypothetical protein
MIVFAQNLLDCPSATEQFDDELHGNARPLNNRFAAQNLGINSNSVFPPLIIFHGSQYTGAVRSPERVNRHASPDTLGLSETLAILDMLHAAFSALSFARIVEILI